MRSLTCFHAMFSPMNYLLKKKKYQVVTLRFLDITYI